MTAPVLFVAYEIGGDVGNVAVAAVLLSPAHGGGAYIAGECRGATYAEAFDLAGRVHGRALDEAREEPAAADPLDALAVAVRELLEAGADLPAWVEFDPDGQVDRYRDAAARVRELLP